MLYPIAIARGDNATAHGIFVPDIDGCVSAADNFQDIFNNATEAIELCLEGLVEDGEEIPLPTSMENYIDNPEYEGMVWAVVPVDINRYLGKTEKVNVTLPSVLINMIDEKVATNKKRYKSRSNFLATLAERELISH